MSWLGGGQVAAEETGPGKKGATGLQAPATRRGGRDGPERVLFLEVGDMQLTDSHRRYWQKNLNITAVLLAIWLILALGMRVPPVKRA